MKQIISIIFTLLLLAGTATAQIIGPVENGNGSMNNVTNQQVQATGGTGIGYGGYASVYAPDYSYNPQSQSNYNNVYSPSSSSAGASIYAPDYSYNYTGSNSSAYVPIDNQVNNSFKPTNRIRIDNNPTINTDIDNRVRVKVNNDVNNTNINKPEFNNTNTIERGAVKNDNTNIQGQKQGQIQGQQQKQDQLQGQDQTQAQNNAQTIAPNQTVTIKAPKPNIQVPTTGMAELNFGNGSLLDVTRTLPKFKGVTLLERGDTIHTVVDVTANVPFKKLYKTILKMAKDNAAQAPYLRFQIMMAEGQKSWTTGGSLSGGGSGFMSGTAAAGGGSLIPQIGGTKAHPLFTIIAVNVIPGE